MRGREGEGEGLGGRRRGGGEGEEEVGEGIKIGEKGKEGKEEILRVIREEDGDKGVGVREGGRSILPVHPSCMLKCVSCVCLFMRMPTLLIVVKC